MNSLGKLFPELHSIENGDNFGKSHWLFARVKGTTKILHKILHKIIPS